MAGLTAFVDDPADTREAIMKATYLALLEHGYADLTIQRIGDEFGKSKSLLYHHYDGKEELLLDFLGFMLERFEATLPPEEHDGTDEYLASILDYVLLPPPDGDQTAFFRALIELRAQAPTTRPARITSHEATSSSATASLTSSAPVSTKGCFGRSIRRRPRPSFKRSSSGRCCKM